MSLGSAAARAVVAGLALWSFAPLAALTGRVLSKGGTLTGADGGSAGADQFLYLDWIRQSGEGALIGNRFDLAPVQEVLLHPFYLLPGLAWRAGVALPVALLLWKPVAIAVLAVGFWAYLARVLPPAGHARAAALFLALFFFSPFLPLLAWSGAIDPATRFSMMLVSGEAMPAWSLWGYPHTAIAIGLVPLCLLGVERVIEPCRRAPGRGAWWYVGLTAAGGMATSWLHPWQGIVLLAVAAGAVVWQRAWQPSVRLVAVAAATLAPIVYFYVLVQTDDAWHVNHVHTQSPRTAAWILAAGLLPLAAPALAGVSRHPRGVQERMLLLWAPAGLAVYLLLDSFPYHALEGLSLPLAILAVRGWRRRRGPGLAGAVAVASLTLPGMVFAADTARESVRSGVSPYWLEDGEREALSWLDRAPRPGGVLARYYLGMTVPAFTGRQTWVGDFFWTPDFGGRRDRAEALFGGELTPAQARAMVREIGPAFLLTDCRSRGDPAAQLGTIVRRVRRFGCARVYELRIASPP